MKNSLEQNVIWLKDNNLTTYFEYFAWIYLASFQNRHDCAQKRNEETYWKRWEYLLGHLKTLNYVLIVGFEIMLVRTFCNPVEKDSIANSSPFLTVAFLHLFQPGGILVPGERTTWISKQQSSGKDGKKLTVPEVCLKTSWISLWTLTRHFGDTWSSIFISTSDSTSKFHFSTASEFS